MDQGDIMCVSNTWFRREEWIKVTLCVCQLHGLGERNGSR